MPDARALDALLDAAEGSVAPSVSALVVEGGRALYRRAPRRVYDLASLTKVLCTTEVALRACADERIALDGGHPLLPEGVTIRHLLQHASGWPAWRPLFEAVPARDGLDPDARRAAIVREALATPPEAPPGERHVYSDIGFLALGAVIEATAGARLDHRWRGPLAWGHPGAQPTGAGPVGVVHDDNARAMGGVAPHAGLFGTVGDVVRVAARWLDGSLPAGWAARFFAERGPGSHALGWDTPSGAASSAGEGAPADAVGHLGFTGTSVWMSPARARVAVLLTNRVALGSELAGIRALRRAFHAEAWR